MEQRGIPPTGGPKRLTRSTRDRMWAGVAGGLAEYFDVDPTLMRLIWVAATIVSGGLAIPVYLVLWIVVPRDDQAPHWTGRDRWSHWSAEFEGEARRFAEEARRLAEEVAGSRRPEAPRGGPEPPPGAPPPWTAGSSEAGAGPSASAASAPEGAHGATKPPPGPSGWAPPSWEPLPLFDEDRSSRRQRVAGIVLVMLGLVFFAQQAGLFRINWSLFWPLILIAIGIGLLVRRASWR